MPGDLGYVENRVDQDVAVITGEPSGAGGEHQGNVVEPRLLVADGAALGLGIGQAGQGGQEGVARVDFDQIMGKDHLEHSQQIRLLRRSVLG